MVDLPTWYHKHLPFMQVKCLLFLWDVVGNKCHHVMYRKAAIYSIKIPCLGFAPPNFHWFPVKTGNFSNFFLAVEGMALHKAMIN